MRTPVFASLAASVLLLAACGSETPEPSGTDSSSPSTVEEDAADEPAETDEDVDAEEEEADEPTTEAAEDSGELGIGGRGTIGDYSVTVTGVELNANEAIKAANEFNDDPTGQYVLVSLAVTYAGSDEGNPGFDLSVELAGSDSRIYDTSSCLAVTANGAYNVPALTSGGKGEYDVCFDVPSEALDNPKIYVEELLSFGNDRLVWDTSKTASTEDTEEEAAPQSNRTDDAHELGDTADVGDYSVTITEVQLDAIDAIKAANEFNDDPTGQYVLASVDVTYNGSEEGDAWLDLQVKLAGSDARIYDTSSCMAVTPNSPMDVPTLTAGGTGAFDVCFDVPVDALDNPQIYVEESMSFDDTREVWETQ